MAPLIGIPLLQVQLHLAASQLPSTLARSSFPGYCDGIWTHPCLLSESHSRKSEGQSYSARDSKTSLLKLSSPQIIRRLSVLSPFWMLVRLIVHSICDVLCPVNSLPCLVFDLSILFHSTSHLLSSPRDDHRLFLELSPERRDH